MLFRYLLAIPFFLGVWLFFGYFGMLFFWHEKISSVPQDSGVYCDGFEMEESEASHIIALLNEMDVFKGKSGSRPEDEIYIEIDVGKRLGVLLKRDSRDDELYWVYNSDYEWLGAVGFLSADRGFPFLLECQSSGTGTN